MGVSHHVCLCADISKDLFYEHEYVSACMSVHHVYAWYLGDQKMALDFLGPWV